MPKQMNFREFRHKLGELLEEAKFRSAKPGDAVLPLLLPGIAPHENGGVLATANMGIVLREEFNFPIEVLSREPFVTRTTTMSDIYTLYREYNPDT